jgi:hypothetical protein
LLVKFNKTLLIEPGEKPMTINKIKNLRIKNKKLVLLTLSCLVTAQFTTQAKVAKPSNIVVQESNFSKFINKGKSVFINAIKNLKSKIPSEIVFYEEKGLFSDTRIACKTSHFAAGLAGLAIISAIAAAIFGNSNSNGKPSNTPEPKLYGYIDNNNNQDPLVLPNNELPEINSTTPANNVPLSLNKWMEDFNKLQATNGVNPPYVNNKKSVEIQTDGPDSPTGDIQTEYSISMFD